MARRTAPPKADRRVAAAEPRPDAERLSLKPLTYEEAVKGLFSVKPSEVDEESEETAIDDRP